MWRKGIILIFILLISTSQAFCQDTAQEPAGIKKNAISFNLFGTTPLIGVTYERLLSKQISFETGLGISSVGLGFKFFPFKIREQKINPHFGITAAFVTNPDYYSSEPDGGTIIYIPLGFSYYSKGGFNFGLDIGLGIFNETINTSSLIPYGNIKLGRRF